jgi:Flp pilus assembly protein CpaB
MGVGGLGTGGAFPGSSGSAGWTPPGARDPRRGRRRRRGRGRGTGRVAVWRLAAGAAAVALAVTAGLLAGRPAPGGRAAAAPGVAVLVAARDLPAGTVPDASDLRTVVLPAPAVPADAVPPAAVPAAAAASGAAATSGAPAAPGATAAGAGGAAGGGGTVGPLAVAARRGDVLTGRQFGTGWAPAGALRAYTLPVGDGVEAGPLAPGDRVDVLAAAHGRARTVLRAAPVLRLVPGGDGRATLVVVGVTAGQAEALAAARAAGTLTLVQAPAG